MSRSAYAERIPIADPQLGASEKEAVLECLDAGQLAAGEEVRQFEAEFANYVDTDHAVATANGTAALQTALEAVGIGDGDTVLTTPFSFVATANAVRFCGADPLFADVDPRTGNLDPAAVAETIEARGGDVDAIIAVHLYGLPARLEDLAAIADAHDAALIEDAAQAHGARYRDDPVGSFGDAACFSFYPTKNMTTGEGGMVVTDRDDVRDRASRFVNHGRDDRYRHVELGHNFRMTDIAAAMGRVQLQRLPDYVEQRRENARRLTDVLENEPLTPPVEPDHARHAYHQYTVQSDDRDALAAALEDRGVDTGVYYPTPIHRQPPYDGSGTFPVAERLSERVLSLPVHPGLSEEDVSTVQRALESAVAATVDR